MIGYEIWIARRGQQQDIRVFLYVVYGHELTERRRWAHQRGPQFTHVHEVSYDVAVLDVEAIPQDYLECVLR
jgi:hypothetical protein